MYALMYALMYVCRFIQIQFDMVEYYDFKLKMILIGSTNVGKSSIVSRFINNDFSISQNQTIGIDIMTSMMNIYNYTVKVQIFDTSGSKRFKSINSLYYSNANVVIFCFDITSRITFDDIKKAIQTFDNNIKKVLVGNKIDMEHLRQIQYQEALNFANENNMLYFETSAKNSIGINDVFTKVTENMTKSMIKEHLAEIKKYTELKIIFPK